MFRIEDKMPRNHICITEIPIRFPTRALHTIWVALEELLADINPLAFNAHRFKRWPVDKRFHMGRESSRAVRLKGATMRFEWLSGEMGLE